MNKLIEAVKALYGMKTKEAKEYIKTITKTQKEYILAGYIDNTKKSFYND